MGSNFLFKSILAGRGHSRAKQNSQRKSSYEVAVVFAIIVQGDQPTYKAAVLSCHGSHAAAHSAAAAASAFTTISGYDGRMQAGRSPAAKKQRYITSNDRYKSRAFSLSSTCVPVPKIRHYQGNFALLYCSLTAFIPTACTGRRQCGDMARARRCRPAAAKAALDSCRQDFLEHGLQVMTL